MNVEIKETQSLRDRKQWVRFALTHYKGHQYYVPQLISDEVKYFDPRLNPAFDVSEIRLFTAIRSGEIVGRICGIINPLEAEKRGCKVGRFGWFESIDDERVAAALLDRIKHWLQDEGCVEMTGPHGFSDLDPGGILVEGFDQIPTIAGSYQYPYYAGLLETFGMEKGADYVEFRVDISKPVALLERLRGKLDGLETHSVVTCATRKQVLANAEGMWGVLEEVFAPLYGVVPLTAEQKRFYTKKYLSFVDPDFVKLGFRSDGELVGFFIGIPNLSHSFRRAGGRLLPFGFAHIFREYRNPATVDFLLAGGLPDEPTSALTIEALIQMYDSLKKRGIRYIETNRELETNTTVNRIWRRFEIVNTRRTRVYKMSLT